MEPVIEKIQAEDFKQILEIADICFPETLDFNEKYLSDYLRLGFRYAMDLSVKLVLDNKIIGFYIMAKSDIGTQALLSTGLNVRTNRGVEGVSLGLLPEYRDKGYGKKLIEYPYTLEQFDYIWGQHFRHLNNKEHWQKRRVIFDNGGEIFFSLGVLREHKVEFKHIQQTESWNCGPTALLMAYQPVTNSKPYSLEEINQFVGADSVTGTTDTRMEAGLKALNVEYKQAPGFDETEAIEWLDDNLIQRNVFLLRGLVHGVKHWVLVTEKVDKEYHILDPWLGEYYLNAKELNDIWEPRNYDGFVLFRSNYE